MTNRAHKYRIYPNEKQAHQLACTFGCVRFVYNLCLEKQEQTYAAGEKYIPKYTMNSGYLTHVLKKEYPFLRDVDKFALTNAVFHLDAAYQRMFQGQGGHPRFKSKRRSRCSYTTCFTNGNIAIMKGPDGRPYGIKLPKLETVKAVIHRLPPDGWVLKSATVSMEKDGTYYCSVLYQYEESIADIPHPENNAVGLDYKSDGLYVSSDQETCGSPKYFRRAQKRLAKLQKDLSRKQGSRRGETESANHRKQKRKVAKLHRHVANQRKDFLHKQSAAIAKQYDLVCVEDLDMKALSNKGFGNGKATLDNGYGTFLTLLEYKLRNRGGMLVRIDQWFPSSQLCSCCGTVHPEVKDVKIRRWTCPDCGAEHDRDINAAVNIRNEGIRQYLADTA